MLKKEKDWCYRFGHVLACPRAQARSRGYLCLRPAWIRKRPRFLERSWLRRHTGQREKGWGEGGQGVEEGMGRWKRTGSPGTQPWEYGRPMRSEPEGEVEEWGVMSQYSKAPSSFLTWRPWGELRGSFGLWRQWKGEGLMHLRRVSPEHTYDGVMAAPLNNNNQFDRSMNSYTHFNQSL